MTGSKPAPRLVVLIAGALVPSLLYGQTSNPPTLVPLWEVTASAVEDHLIMPMDAALDASGRVWVADAACPCLRIFSRQGTMQSVGRRGQGPGEFDSPMEITIATDGTVYVADRAAQKILQFDEQGVFLSDVRTTVRTAGTPTWLEAVDGGLFVRHWNGIDSRIEFWPSIDPAGARLVFAPSDEFPVVEHALLKEQYAVATGPRGSLWIGAGVAEYTLRQFDREGRVMRELTRSIEAEPVDLEVVDILAELADALPPGVELGAIRQMTSRVLGVKNNDLESLAEALSTSPHFGPYALTVDGVGRVWVLTSRLRGSYREVDVFAPEGTYLGSLDVPPFAARLIASGDRMIVIAVEDFSGSSIGVYEIQ